MHCWPHGQKFGKYQIENIYVNLMSVNMNLPAKFHLNQPKNKRVMAFFIFDPLGFYCLYRLFMSSHSI